MRQAARDYIEAAREALAHKGRSEEAVKADGVNLLCSIFMEAQCADSYIKGWIGENETLSNRVATTKVALDRSKDELERLVARYGLYRRTEASPSGDGTSAENTL